MRRVLLSVMKKLMKRTTSRLRPTHVKRNKKIRTYPIREDQKELLSSNSDLGQFLERTSITPDERRTRLLSVTSSVYSPNRFVRLEPDSNLSKKSKMKEVGAVRRPSIFDNSIQLSRDSMGSPVSARMTAEFNEVRSTQILFEHQNFIKWDSFSSFGEIPLPIKPEDPISKSSTTITKSVDS